MVEHIEIEIRAAVDKKTILSRLIALGAERVSESAEHDEYFKFGLDESRRLVVRIRKKGERTLLTFKGSSKLAEDVAWQEWETPISDSDNLKKLLLSNGLVPVVTIDKHRITFHHEHFEINVDHIAGLGDFVEVELHAEDAAAGRAQVAAFLEKELRVPQTAFITKGYVPLMLEQAKHD
jgi:adenylate cyclase, class 2